MKSKSFLKTLVCILINSILVSSMPVYATENIEQTVSHGDAGQGNESTELDYVLGRPMTEAEIRAQQEITEAAMANNSFLPSTRDYDEIYMEGGIQLFGAGVPSSYDSRNVNGVSYVSAVKNQNPYGTCWAFAGIACAESDLIHDGYFSSSVNFSESHLIFFGNHSAPDVLGNDYQDSVSYAGATSYLQVGGNEDFCYGALSTWKGAVSEGDAPYSEVENGLEQSTEIAYLQDIAHMQGFYLIHKANVDLIKAAIMEHGAVGASYYEKGTYRNYSTAAYFCNDEGVKSNHAIAVVGWDDDYSKENFNAAIQPSTDGAWLIKNSWGSDWGDEGYFWISYEDVTLDGFYAMDMEPADNYDNNYQYDFCSPLVTRTVRVTQAASVFEVKANEGKMEQLKAVSISLTNATNVNYSIQIYRNLTDMSDPTSGTPMLSEPQTGFTTLAGYYTIPLDETVKLCQGDVYSVVFTFEESTKVDAERGYNNTFVLSPSSRANESYIYQNGWADYGAAGDGNIRIKAFTGNLDENIVECTSVSVDKATADILAGESFTLTAEVLPVDASNNGVIWSSSNPAVATVDSNGKVMGLAGGTAIITAKTYNGNCVAKCLVSVTAPEITYTVVYDKNGAEAIGTMANQAFVYLSGGLLAANAYSRNGFTFTGWNTKADGTGTTYLNQADGSRLALTSGAVVTLYAQWQPDTYKITYKLNGGKNNSKNPSGYTVVTDTFTLEKPTKTGYTFGGWYSDSRFKNKVTTISRGSMGSKTLYAKWIANKYTVRFSRNGATKGKMTTLTNRVYGKAYKLKSNTFTKKGYTFAGWNTKKNGTGKTYKNKSNIKNLTTANKKTVTLYAQWEPVNYRISYSLNGGKNSSRNPKKYTVATKTITLKKPTKKGYTFAGWYSDRKLTKKVTKIKKGSTGNIRLYAKWVKN